MLSRLLVEEEGQTLVEYSLLIGLIALVVIMALSFFGRNLKGHFSAAGNSIKTETS